MVQAGLLHSYQTWRFFVVLLGYEPRRFFCSACENIAFTASPCFHNILVLYS